MIDIGVDYEYAYFNKGDQYLTLDGIYTFSESGVYSVSDNSITKVSVHHDTTHKLFQEYQNSKLK